MAGVRRVPWRRVVVGGLVVAAVIAALVMVRRDPPAPPDASADGTVPPVTGPSPTGSLPLGVDAAPAPGDEHRLPQRVTVLPAEVVLDPAGVPGLSEAPVRRAHALVEVRGDEETVGAVFVVGDDGRLRSLDVVHVSPVEDRDGNRRSPFHSTMLRADGVVAAFAQRDRVALVDLTTAAVRWVPVPGFNEYLVWHGDELVVAQAAATFRVDAVSGRVWRTAERGLEVAAADRQDAAVVELSGGGPVAPLLRVRAGGRAVDRRVGGLSGSVGWVSPARVSDRRVAAGVVTASATPGTPPVSGVVVVDIDTGLAVRRLQPPTTMAATGGCCTVAGWLDRHVVLVYALGTTGWLLAWDITTGQVSRVTQFRSPTGRTISVSLADLAR